MIRQILAPVLSNQPLPAPGHHVLTFQAGEMAGDARPGSFVAVAADTGPQILRRPFSFFSADPETGAASVLFSVHGPTSRRMAALRPGDTLDVIGPLGRRLFTPDPRPGARHILIGGGYGVPPLVFFARRLRAKSDTAPVIFINGARSGELLLVCADIEATGARLSACTDDGSLGTRGRVTDILGPLLDENVPTTVYACGPTLMMRAVAEMCLPRAVPCAVSLEPFMPCGIGICVGCAVPKTDGTFARGCYDGPVFDAREVRWE